MKSAHFFIDRPVFASVISIVTIIVGALSIFTLPVAQYPEIVPPTVIVTANYPAQHQTIADAVAAPMEQQINGVENMLYMSSQSTNDGQLSITVTFKLGTRLDDAQVQVQNRVAIAEPTLPEEVRRLGVTVKKRSPDITLAVQFYSPMDPATGKPARDMLYISNFATRSVRDEIARLDGVGDVFLFGARDYAMRVWLDPQKVASRNMTTGDVVNAIREQNIQVAAGTVGQQPLPKEIAPPLQLTVNAQGRLQTEDQFQEIVIKTGEAGEIVRLKDVARVELGAKDYSLRVYAGAAGEGQGDESIGMPVFQLPGSNAIKTADAVMQKMKELRASPDWPAGVEYRIPFDTTIFVRQSMKDVVKTLSIAILLVVIVVVAFLQNWRAAIIPLAAVPVSLIGTCAIMWPLGFSLNNLSMFGLVLAIGIVVDDAIVVVENVERWIDKGLKPRQATYEAMREVTPAVLAVAAGLSAVFIPTAFISGITGQFYRQFALTIAVSTLISAFNSLTLSPALAAILLKPRQAKKDWLERIIEFLLGWFFGLFNRTFNFTNRAYVGTLKRVVRLSALALLVYVGLLGVTGWGFTTVPTGFIPQQDKGYLLCVLQMPDAASLERTDAALRRMETIARTTPGVKFTFAVNGFSVLSGTNQSNAAVMFLSLKDFDDRAGHPEQSLNGILGALMGKFSQIQDGLALVFPPPAVQGMGNAGGYKIQIQDTGGHTPQELQAASEQFVAATLAEDAQRPEGQRMFQQMLPSFRATVPQLWANVDREKVKKQGVEVTDVFNTLQTYLGSLYVNDFNLSGRTYQVTAQADARFRATSRDVGNLKTRNHQNEMVPLSAVVDMKDITGPVRIGRYNLKSTADVNITSLPGIASGDVIAEIERSANQNLPVGFGVEWTELAYQEKIAGNSALWIFPMCVLFVFLVHSAEYESWSLPTAIILIVPMCLLSGILGVMFMGMDNNIFTQIGFVVLAGLSAKNAVLIVEFAKQQQEQGKNRVEAAIEAARLRLRPILMTSFAFILGVLPLVFARGAGAEMRQALGTVVFFGMIGVTFFGVFLTPVFYVTIRWITEHFFPGSAKMHGHNWDRNAEHEERGDGNGNGAGEPPFAQVAGPQGHHG